MKKSLKNYKIINVIYMKYRSIMPCFFWCLSICFFILSLPEGNTKVKNCLWGISLVLSFLLYLIRDNVSHRTKLIPFFVYILICFCSLPLNKRIIVHQSFFMVKPFVITVSMIFLILFNRTGYLFKKIRKIVIFLLINTILYEILILGELRAVYGLPYETMVGNIFRIYLEIFFLCFGAAISLSSKKVIFVNKTNLAAIINYFFICCPLSSGLLVILCRLTNEKIYFKEFLYVLVPFWALEIIFLYQLKILFTKRRFPGDRLSKKLFYDYKDIEMSKRQLLRYKTVVKQIKKIKDNINNDNDLNDDDYNKLNELIKYEEFLKKNNVIIYEFDDEKNS